MTLRVVLVACIAFVALSRPGLGADELVFNDEFEPPFTNPERTGYLDRIYTEAFHRMGLRFRFVKLPAERALRSANDGTIDGDVSRIAGLQRTYPNLVMVPFKLTDVEFTAFTRAPMNNPPSWDQLISYQVGYIKGWKIFELNTPRGTTLVPLRSTDQMFDMFNRGRLQVILYSRYMGMEYAKKHHIQGVHPWLPSLAKMEMYPYLHRKHQATVREFSQVLEQLKREGFIDKVYAELILPLAH